jgi:preprotein translocase subunit SecA
VVYKTETEKFVAVVEEIAELHRKGQPVLVGTISIDKSERLSRMLKEPGPFLKRMATVCQWAAEELTREQLPDDLRKPLAQLVSRPAMLDERAAADLLSRLTAQAPKSVLVYRLEAIVRLAQTIASVKAGVPHNVLNAKYHEHEARIVAQAGRFGAVTIATNMAGRGTDILLGGNPQFLAEDAIREQEAQGTAITEEDRRRRFEELRGRAEEEHNQVVARGGLHVLGTERHEARRIDNQLRGRSGRQGDPGSSRFYLSLEDDLMRIFGSDRIARLMEFKWFKWEEGLPIEHPWVTKSIATAQRRVEGQNFEARKHLLEYDDVMNRQREVIYEQRRRILEGVELKGLVEEIIEEVADELAATYAPKEARPEAWDIAGLCSTLSRQFGVGGAIELSTPDREELITRTADVLRRAYHAKEQAVGEAATRSLERSVLLAVVDAKWKDHLYMMDALREGIGLRAYGQRDPLVEYQHEAYAMFQDMITSIKADALTMLLRIQPAAEAQPVSVFARTPQQTVHEELSTRLADRFAAASAEEGQGSRVKGQGEGDQRVSLHPAPFTLPAPGPQPPAAAQRIGPKVGRNDPCPCGSGLKYKKCHGK